MDNVSHHPFNPRACGRLLKVLRQSPETIDGLRVSRLRAAFQYQCCCHSFVSFSSLLSLFLYLLPLCLSFMWTYQHNLWHVSLCLTLAFALKAKKPNLLVSRRSFLLVCFSAHSVAHLKIVASLMSEHLLQMQHTFVVTLTRLFELEYVKLKVSGQISLWVSSHNPQTHKSFICLIACFVVCPWCDYTGLSDHFYTTTTIQLRCLQGGNKSTHNPRYKTPPVTMINITRKYSVVCCRWTQTLCLWSACLSITKRYKNLSQIFLCLHKCHHSTRDIFSNTKSAIWRHLCRYMPRHQPKSSLSAELH